MTHAPDLESRAAPDDHHALRLWLKRNPVHDHPSLAEKPR